MNAQSAQRYYEMDNEKQSKPSNGEKRRRWPINETVLRHLIINGLSNVEIAQKFGVSVSDVDLLIRHFDMDKAHSSLSWE